MTKEKSKNLYVNLNEVDLEIVLSCKSRKECSGSTLAQRILPFSCLFLLAIQIHSFTQRGAISKQASGLSTEFGACVP